MTDDLLKRLREMRGPNVWEAADRIEELEKNFELQLEWYLSNKRRLDDRIEELEAALTPSGTTKAAYIGEFKFKISPRREVMVPWTTIKEIMAAIMANAALEKKDD